MTDKTRCTVGPTACHFSMLSRKTFKKFGKRPCESRFRFKLVLNLDSVVSDPKLHNGTC